MVLVPLTFSPGRPLSPTVPGSVRPGRPYIVHSDVSSELRNLQKEIKQETPDMCCYSHAQQGHTFSPLGPGSPATACKSAHKWMK